MATYKVGDPVLFYPSEQRRVVYGGGERFPLAEGVAAVSLPDLCEELAATWASWPFSSLSVGTDMAREPTATTAATIGYEARLWQMADALRNSHWRGELLKDDPRRTYGTPAGRRPPHTERRTGNLCA